MSDIEQYKQEICDIGDRLYKRGFAAANDGNITYRISENEVLCTPTMVNKGFMKPADIALIDDEGVWLRAKDARVEWTPTDLFGGELVIEPHLGNQEILVVRWSEQSHFGRIGTPFLPRGQFGFDAQKRIHVFALGR